MDIFINTSLVIGLFLLIGLAIKLGIKDDDKFIESISLSFSIGPTLITFLMLCFLIVKFNLTKEKLDFFLISIGVLSLIFILLKFKKIFKANLIKLSLKKREIILMILIIIGFIGVIIGAISIPMLQWDERAIWGYKAKILFYNFSISSEWFKEPYIVDPHPNYPLSIPILETIIYYFLEEINDRFVKLLFPYFFAGIILTTYSFLKITIPTLIALFFTLSITLLPGIILPLDGGATTGYADVPLALHIIVSLFCLVKYLEEKDKRFLYFTAISTAGAIYTKQEGFITALSICVILLIYSAQCKNYSTIFLFIFWVVILIIPIVFFHHLSPR